MTGSKGKAVKEDGGCTGSACGDNWDTVLLWTYSEPRNIVNQNCDQNIPTTRPRPTYAQPALYITKSTKAGRAYTQ